FERLMSSQPAALTSVLRWEDHLSALTRRVTPMQPSPRVWEGINSRLFGDRATPARGLSRRRLIQFALAASVVATAIVVGVLLRERPPELQSVAALGTDPVRPVWQVDRQAHFAALRIRVVGTVEQRAGKSYELWALPKGGAPVSLGLMPVSGIVD